ALRDDYVGFSRLAYRLSENLKPGTENGLTVCIRVENPDHRERRENRIVHHLAPPGGKRGRRRMTGNMSAGSSRKVTGQCTKEPSRHHMGKNSPRRQLTKAHGSLSY